MSFTPSSLNHKTDSRHTDTHTYIYTYTERKAQQKKLTAKMRDQRARDLIMKATYEKMTSAAEI